MTPVIQFPIGPLDPVTARTLAQHERMHLAFARNLDPERRARAEAEICEFERSHGVDGQTTDSRRIVSWSCSDAAVNSNVAPVPEPR